MNFGGGNNDLDLVDLPFLFRLLSSAVPLKSPVRKVSPVCPPVFTAVLQVAVSIGMCVGIGLRTVCSQNSKGRVPGPIDFRGERCTEMLPVGVGK